MADNEDKVKKTVEDILKYQESLRRSTGDWIEDLSDAVDLTAKVGREMNKVNNAINEAKEAYSASKRMVKEKQKLLDQTHRTIDGMNRSILEERNLYQKIGEEKKDYGQEVMRLQEEDYFLKQKSNDLMMQLVTGAGNVEEITEKIKENARLQAVNAEQQIVTAEKIAKLTKQEISSQARLVQMKQARSEEESKAKQLGKEISGELKNQAKILGEIEKLNFMMSWLNILKLGLERFIALDKAAEAFRKETGFTTDQMANLRQYAEQINVQFQEMGIGVEQAYKSAKALTDVFGRASLVTKEAMQNVALLAANLGVAEEDSANVLSIFQGLGGLSEKAAMNVLETSAVLANNAGVPFSLVMKDIANASEQTLAMVSANPTKLMKSAVAARALGADLNKLVASQRKLLDFTSSINDELELSALLGKSVNFQKARQLAYEGKVEDAAKATLETVRAAGDFDKMNVYQREALAKASGMELKDLTKMMAVDKQRRAIMMGSDEKAKERLRAQDAALKKLKDQNDLSQEGIIAENEKIIAQQKMQGMMTRLGNLMQTLAVVVGDVFEPIITSIVTVLVPILTVVAGIVKGIFGLFKFILIPVKALIDIVKDWWDTSEGVRTVTDAISKTTAKIAEAQKVVYDWFKSAKGEAKDWYKWVAMGAGALVGIYITIKSMKALSGGLSLFGKGAGAAGGMAGKTGGLLDKLGGGVSKLTKGAGGMFEGVMKSVANGIGELGSPKVLKGALAMLLLGSAVAVFAGAMILFSKVDWKAVIFGGVALAAFAGAAFLLGALITGPGAVIFGAGLIGIAALGVALVPFAAAALMAGAGVKLLGSGIKDAIDPIERLAKLDMTSTALGIGAIGLALAAFGAGQAATGLGSFVGNFLGGDPIKKLERLSAIGPQLMQTAQSLDSIGASLKNFTMADSFAKSIDIVVLSLEKLNKELEKVSLLKLAAVTAAGVVSSKAAEKAGGTQDAVVNKLDELITLMRNGGIGVNMDSKKVSSALAVGGT